MDLLSDILQDASLRRRVLGLRAIPANVALRFPCEKSIGLHVVVHPKDPVPVGAQKTGHLVPHAPHAALVVSWAS